MPPQNRLIDVFFTRKFCLWCWKAGTKTNNLAKLIARERRCPFANISSSFGDLNIIRGCRSETVHPAGLGGPGEPLAREGTFAAP